MKNQTSDSKRLAKNTLLLYMRTLLIMAITLYTSRVILDTLGIEDYGVYQIVGGFVSFFSIISGTLIATTQRYLTFELGKQEKSDPKLIFGAAMTIHFVLVIILFLLLESIGLWFLNHKLNIPFDRISAANWVFQFSIFSFLVGVLSSPYNAVIIAHEKMSAFAYISLLEALLKLGIVYILYLSLIDKLILYGFLLLCANIIIRLVYSSYCKRHFEETDYHITKNVNLYKEMFGFASMNFLGSAASILCNYGVDIIINIFYGVTLNAARGIANQVQHAVVKFVNDFMTALKPQITKEFAAGNLNKSRLLCFRGSKYSFFLMSFFAVPIYFRAEYILELWLNVYPDYAPVFLRLTLILAMFTLLSNSLTTEILATGKLSKAVLAIGGTRLLTLPFVFLLFTLDLGAETAYYVLIIIEFLSLYVRLFILNYLTKIEFVISFSRDVLVRLLVTAFPSFGLCMLVNPCIQSSFPGLLLFTLITVVCNLLFISFVGLSSFERKSIYEFVLSKIQRI